MREELSVFDKDPQDQFDNSGQLPDPSQTDRPRPPDDGREPPTMHILVNEHRVRLSGRDHTGAQIKRAAIRAGVQVEPDFVLSVEYGEGRRKLIGDNEVVQLRDGLRFVAIPDDDNS